MPLLKSKQLKRLVLITEYNKVIQSGSESIMKRDGWIAHMEKRIHDSTGLETTPSFSYIEPMPLFDAVVLFTLEMSNHDFPTPKVDVFKNYLN